MGKPLPSMTSSTSPSTRTQAIQEVDRLTILKENIEAEMVRPSPTRPSRLLALLHVRADDVLCRVGLGR